jgi:hypothetical protein
MRIPDFSTSWDGDRRPAARMDRVLAACAVLQLGLLVGWVLNGGSLSAFQDAPKVEPVAVAASAPDRLPKRTETQLHLEQIHRMASTPWMGWLARIEAVEVPGVTWEELKAVPEAGVVHLTVTAPDADHLSVFVAELQRVLVGERAEVVPELHARVDGVTRLRTTIRFDRSEPGR